MSLEVSPRISRGPKWFCEILFARHRTLILDKSPIDPPTEFFTTLFKGILATSPRNKGLIFGLIKGNQWLINPDHKAGYFLGGPGPRIPLNYGVDLCSCASIVVLQKKEVVSNSTFWIFPRGIPSLKLTARP